MDRELLETATLVLACKQEYEEECLPGGSDPYRVSLRDTYHAVAICEAPKLASAVVTLASWKAEAIAVESSWDVQAIGKLVGVPLGGDIRKAVQPAIEALQSERDALAARVKELEEMQTGATEAVDHYIQELHDMALLADQDSDTDERIIGACHARHHMFRGQEQAKTKEQSGEGL